MRKGEDLTRPGRRLSDAELDALNAVAETRAELAWETNKFPFERQWMINLAHYMGYQDIRWDKTFNRPITSGRANRHRSRYTANKHVDAVEKAVSQFAELRPKWMSMPRTSSIEDRQASRFSNSLLDYYWDEAGMEEEVAKSIEWAAITGTGFLLNSIKSDPRTKERIYIDPQTGQTLPSVMLQTHQMRALEKMGSYIDYFAAEPTCKAISPFRVMVDAGASDLEEARRLYTVTTQDVDAVHEKYGVRVPEVELPEGMSDYEQRLRSFYGPYSGVSSSAGAQQPGHAARTAVEEVFIKPYAKRNQRGDWDEHPEGRHIVIAGGEVVHDGPNMAWKMGFPTGFPLSMMKWHNVPGRLWGMGLVEMMLDPVRAYNDLRRATIDNFKTMGRPKWTAAKGSGLAKRAIDDQPGEVIFYNANVPRPEPVQPMAMDGSSVNILTEAARFDIMDSAAQHDIQQGQIPSQMRSAPGMELALEADRQSLKPKVRRLIKMISQAGEGLIRTAAEVIDENTYVEIVGSGHDSEFVAFKAAILRGVKSVRIIPSSMMPTSRGMHLQKVMDMAQAGIINPAASSADRELVLRASEFHEGDPELTSAHQERRSAERENEVMSFPVGQGFELPQVNPWDDDIIHLTAHHEWFRSTEFKLLPPEQQQAAIGHSHMHQQRLMQAEQARMMQLQASKGAPGPKGRPSPPKGAQSPS